MGPYSAYEMLAQKLSLKGKERSGKYNENDDDDRKNLNNAEQEKDAWLCYFIDEIPKGRRGRVDPRKIVGIEILTIMNFTEDDDHII